MHEFLLNDSEAINWYLWMAVLAAMSTWESIRPRRQLSTPLRRRWAGNISLMAAGIFIIWWSAPVLCLGFSRMVLEWDWGLLPLLGCPVWLNVVLGVLVVDLARFVLHYAAHRSRWLWRIHRIHHTDQDFDFTTSMRFHPIELGAITAMNLALIAALGIHPIAILVVESLSLAVNTFNHGNVRLPEALDRTLRTALVTPDMHRVHHSSEPREYNANIGGFLSCWDRLFGTYVAQPSLGHQKMRIGLPSYADPKHATLWWMLVNPVLSVDPSPHPESPRPQRSAAGSL